MNVIDIEYAVCSTELINAQDTPPHRPTYNDHIVLYKLYSSFISVSQRLLI